MNTRGRTLTVGVVLLAVVVAGLVVGFLTLGNNGDSTGTTGTTPPVTATTPTDPKAQVEQAYLHAWDVWAYALLHLDPSGLSESFTGPALKVVTSQVQQQKRKDQPVQISAEHNYTIALIDPRTASVEDHYINHNVRLDPNTMQPIEPDQETHIRRTFTLKLVGSTWKIADIIGYR